jgi:hypothetical protein
VKEDMGISLGLFFTIVPANWAYGVSAKLVPGRLNEKLTARIVVFAQTF